MAADPDRLLELFDASFDLDAEERARLLDAECDDDPALRAELEDLLERARAQATEGLLPALEAPERLWAGRRIGPYRIVSQLGEGGMGVVFEVWRDDVGKRAALKLVRDGVLSTQKAIRRFLQERRILASLEHPGIAALLDAGVTDDGIPYFIMEYVDGQPIGEYCRNRDADLDFRLRLFVETCEAVEAAHEKGVVHRDLKPANILVAGDGRIRLVDFGIARAAPESDGADMDSPEVLTRTGMLLATPEYASPEQIAGSEVGPASDVYSLGVVLYELVTGQRPYALPVRTSPAAIERAIRDSRPTPPSRLSADNWTRSTTTRYPLRGSSDLDLIVLKALAKEPSLRYATAAEFGEDLRRLLGKRPVLARKPSITYRATSFVRRRRREVTVIGTTILMTLIAAAVILRGVSEDASSAPLFTTGAPSECGGETIPNLRAASLEPFVSEPGASCDGNGLLGCWRFDEEEGQIAHDAGPGGHHGVAGLSVAQDVGDPIRIPGRSGGALRFGGGRADSIAAPSPSFVLIPTARNLEPAGAVTVELWFRSPEVPGKWSYLVGKGGEKDRYASYAIYSGITGGLFFYVTTDTPAGPRISLSAGVDTRIWDGAWHHAAGTYDGERVRLFVDGTEIGAAVPASGPIHYETTYRELVLGSYGSDPCLHRFAGDIDEVRIWGRALAADEISERM